MLTNGWEFFILNPFDSNIKQTTQDKYMDMYNKAYNIFISQMCIPEPNDILEDNFSFLYYIDLTNDIIELEEYYEYNFLKSVFLNKKYRKIRTDVTEYYNIYNINVVNIYVENNSLYLLLNKK